MASQRGPDEPLLDDEADMAKEEPFCFSHKCCLLFCGIWMGLCGGTLYGFSAFEVQMKESCGLSSAQLGLVYGCGQIGVGLGIICGMLYDVRGPTYVCIYGGILGGIGNLILAWAVTPVAGDTLQCNAGGSFIAVVYLVAINGSTGLYQAGLFSNIRSAGEHSQGVITGVVAGGYGLSALFWTTLFDRAMGKSLPTFFRVTGVAFGATGAVAAFLLPWLMPLAAKRRNTSLGDSHKGGFTTETGSSQHWTLTTILHTAEFWLLLCTFAFVATTGSGLFIANLGLMGQSLGIDPSVRLHMTGGLSFFNFCGRVASGLVMDHFSKRHVPRGVHSAWVALIMFLAPLGLFFSQDSLASTLFPCVLMAGFAYGSIWSIMPSYLAAQFGHAHGGLCFNLCASSMSVVVAIVTYVIGGMVDDVSRQQGGTVCKGAVCWTGPIKVGLCVGGFGLVTSCILAYRLFHNGELRTPTVTPIDRRS